MRCPMLPLGKASRCGPAILYKESSPEGAASEFSIHVNMFNPALALYERLGFRKQRQVGVYHFIEWSMILVGQTIAFCRLSFSVCWTLVREEEFASTLLYFQTSR
jgi:hypothetical protein